MDRKPGTDLNSLLRAACREDGSAAVEWAILAASIAAVVIVTVAALGLDVEALFQRAATLITSLL